MNDLNNPVLLGSRHLVVGGEAEASAEEIRAYVDALSLDVGIGFAPAVALDGDEGVGAIDGLHMHWLPDRSSFRLEGGDGIKDFLGGAFAGYALVEVILLPADHGSHGVFINQAAGEPEVRLAVLLVIGVHGDG